MTAKVTINNEERTVILFPFYDTDGCVEAMAEAMWQVLDTIVSCEESKSMISANALNQLVKMNKMLTNDRE